MASLKGRVLLLDGSVQPAWSEFIGCGLYAIVLVFAWFGTFAQGDEDNLLEGGGSWLV